MTLNESNGNNQTITFEGNYGTNNAFRGGGGSYVGEDKSISLFGNVWKAYKLDTPYSSTINTQISFDFEVFEEAEGHAICADEDVNADTLGGYRIRCIALAGTQYNKWSELHVKKAERATIGTKMSLTVRIGDMFPEVGTQINYIAFVQDNDEFPFKGTSRFRNIELFDSPVSLDF